MLQLFKIRLAARAYLYLINAYTDAYLAKKLVVYARYNEFGRSLFFKHRLTKILEISGQSGRAQASIWSIWVVAYTQYYWNGLYDYLLATLMIRLLKVVAPGLNKKLIFAVKSYQQRLKMTHAYQEFHSSSGRLLFNLLKPLVLLGKKRLFALDLFDERFGANLQELESNQIVSKIIETEKLNIESNHRYAQALAGLNLVRLNAVSTQQKNLSNHNQGEDVKLQALYDFMHSISSQEHGVQNLQKQKTARNSLIRTLNAASFWDQLFVKLLELRF
jgi:hypothetical protein